MIELPRCFASVWFICIYINHHLLRNTSIDSNVIWLRNNMALPQPDLIVYIFSTTNWGTPIYIQLLLNLKEKYKIDFQFENDKRSEHVIMGRALAKCLRLLLCIQEISGLVLMHGGLIQSFCLKRKLRRKLLIIIRKLCTCPIACHTDSKWELYWGYKCHWNIQPSKRKNTMSWQFSCRNTCC